MDSLRPDHLGCYGYKRDTSPNIDKFAQNGILFTQAISTSTWTFSSLPSILTSLYPRYHGLYGFYWDTNSQPFLSQENIVEIDTLKSNSKNMAELLMQNGYFTCFISGSEIIKILKDNLNIGYNKFEVLDGVPDASKMKEISMRWLRSLKRTRFFLWIHFFEPHSPYKPPHPFNKLFVNDGKSIYSHKKINIANGCHDYYGVIPRCIAENGIDDVDYYISQYDGEIRYVDEEIGKLWQFIKERKLDKDTLVIIMADHGEFLGEHNFWFGHGWKPYEPVIRIPLIISYPNKLPQNRTVKSPVSLIDIMPTILQLCKIKIPRVINGKSLLSLISKTSGDDWSQRELFIEHKWKSTNSFYAAIRTGSWKLIYHNQGGYELYNLKNDPRELINLVEIEKEKFKELKKELEEFMQGSSKEFSSSKTLDKKDLENLRSLGYLQ